MVFNDIVSIAEVINGHRIIIYFIESEQHINSSDNLSSRLQSLLESLEKKNDDLLLIKVPKHSEQFGDFQYIYKPVISDGITLFVINTEGIPLKSLNVKVESDITEVISTLIQICGLKPLPDVGSLLESVNMNLNASTSVLHSPMNSLNTSKLQEHTLQSTSEKVLNTASNVNLINEHGTNSTKLQIRLPDGNKDVQKFDKEALLNEVQSFISSKHKLKDFDLKTFNRQTFSGDDYEKTLTDLELHPNGVIIVVLKKHVGLNDNRSIVNFVQTGVRQLVTSTTSFIRYVQSFLFTIWMRYFSSTNSDRSNGNSIQSQKTRSSLESTGQKKTKRYESKAFGNIHTLRRNNDSDDENNRYNGNSTQQK